MDPERRTRPRFRHFDVLDIWTFSTFSAIEGDFVGCCDDGDVDGRKEESAAARARPTSGSGASASAVRPGG